MTILLGGAPKALPLDQVPVVLTAVLEDYAMSETRQAVLKFLVGLAPNDETRSGLNEKTELMNSGVLDSFGVVQLILFIEESFGVRIPDSEIGPELFASATAISDYIDAKRPAAVSAIQPSPVPVGA
jgi:acyl carrier protein